MRCSGVHGKESCKNAIIAIGQDLIKRAEEISSDLEYVGSITIHAKLNPTEITNLICKFMSK